MVKLAEVAQEIAAHAANPPKQPGDAGRRINPLSPHFERLATELIRKVLIGRTQEAEVAVATELLQFKTFLPEALHGQFDHSVAKIAEALHSIYKS